MGGADADGDADMCGADAEATGDADDDAEARAVGWADATGPADAGAPDATGLAGGAIERGFSVGPGAADGEMTKPAVVAAGDLDGPDPRRIARNPPAAATMAMSATASGRTREREDIGPKTTGDDAS